MTKKKPIPLEAANDPLHFRAVIDWCRKRGLSVRRCSEFQIKVEGWSYYTKGTFHHDGDTKRRGVGFAAFKVAVEAWLEDEGLAETLKR